LEESSTTSAFSQSSLNRSLFPRFIGHLDWLPPACARYQKGGRHNSTRQSEFVELLTKSPAEEEADVESSAPPTIKTPCFLGEVSRAMRIIDAITKTAAVKIKPIRT
jgi:hypothetical protein